MRRHQRLADARSAPVERLGAGLDKGLCLADGFGDFLLQVAIAGSKLAAELLNLALLLQFLLADDPSGDFNGLAFGFLDTSGDLILVHGASLMGWLVSDVSATLAGHALFLATAGVQSGLLVWID
jgi:hypothetical protein